MDLYIYNIIHINYTFKTCVFSHHFPGCLRSHQILLGLPKVHALPKRPHGEPTLRRLICWQGMDGGLVVVTFRNRDRRKTQKAQRKGGGGFFFLCGGGCVWKSSEIYGDCYC